MKYHEISFTINPFTLWRRQISTHFRTVVQSTSAGHVESLGCQFVALGFTFLPSAQAARVWGSRSREAQDPLPQYTKAITHFSTKPLRGY